MISAPRACSGTPTGCPLFPTEAFSVICLSRKWESAVGCYPAALEELMSRRIAYGALIAVFSFSTIAAAEERKLPPVHHHHHHVWRASGDIVVRAPPPFYPVGFISNGTNVEEGGANGVSGDDSYGPPLGFH